MTDYIPTTEEVKDAYLDKRSVQVTHLDSDPVYEFDRWLKQRDQVKELEVREKVAREIEEKLELHEEVTSAYTAQIAMHIRADAVKIAKGDSK